MTKTGNLAAGPHTRLAIIGAASALGSPHAGAASAPDALRVHGLPQRLANAGIVAEWAETLHPLELPAKGTDMAARLHANAAFASRLANHVAALDAEHFPLVIGG
ncbi:MAG: ornithine--oxo-acid transaminase, partial [Betaproteobacteria bacterium HGW-Betaproteobacteria-19]